MALDLPNKYLTLVKEILAPLSRSYKVQVVIFGSRAKGTARKYSDLDIGLLGQSKLPFAQIVALKNQFYESSLPYTVDLVDFANVEESFKNIALSKYERIL